METNSCPFCGSANITSREEIETFTYGVRGEPQFKIKAKILVDGCADCGQESTDHRAEEARTEAVISTLYTHIKTIVPNKD